jgi:two-component system nitrate/nitrite response regulator NarL
MPTPPNTSPKKQISSSRNPVKTIYIIDDHPIVLAALRGVVIAMEGCSLVGSTTSVSEALAEIGKVEPDLIITDFNHGGYGGYERIHTLKEKFQHIPVLLFTTLDELMIGPRAFRERVDGVLMKDAEIATIKEAITHLLAGNKWASGKLIQLMLSQNTGKIPEDILTRREYQVYCQLGEGKTTRIICDVLSISIKTVENHRENIKKKLHVNNSVKLQANALEHALRMRTQTSDNK